MFRRSKKTADNPDIQKARAERDELVAGAAKASNKVDRLVDELLNEYIEAEQLGKR